MRIDFRIFYLVILIFYGFFHNYDYKNIAGTYKTCPFHCLIVEVDSNLSFKYTLVSDLFTGEYAIGKLIPLGDGYFLANSNIHANVPKEFHTNRNSIFISIKDENSDPLEYVSIKFNSSDSIYEVDSLGNLIIPSCELKTIEIIDYVNIVYKITNPQADSIIINHLTENFIIENERWLFKNDSLFLPEMLGIPKYIQ